MALAQSLAELLGRLRALDAVIETLHGSHRLEAQASASIARLFAEWAAVDARDEHGALEAIQRLLESNSKYTTESSANWYEWRQALPMRQVTDSIILVNNAIRTAAATGTLRSASARASSPQGWSLMRTRIGADGYYRSVDTGRVVFGHGYSKIINFVLPSIQASSLSSIVTDAAAVASLVDEAASTVVVSAIASETRSVRSMLAPLGVNLATCHINPATHLNRDLSINVTSGNIAKCLASAHSSRSTPSRRLVAMMLARPTPRAPCPAQQPCCCAWLCSQCSPSRIESPPRQCV